MYSDQTIAELTNALQTGAHPTLAHSSRGEKSAWIESFVRESGYAGLNRDERGVVRAYIQAVTGYSRAQMTRYIGATVPKAAVIRAIKTDAPRIGQLCGLVGLTSLMLLAIVVSLPRMASSRASLSFLNTEQTMQAVAPDLSPRSITVTTHASDHDEGFPLFAMEEVASAEPRSSTRDVVAAANLTDLRVRVEARRAVRLREAMSAVGGRGESVAFPSRASGEQFFGAVGTGLNGQVLTMKNGKIVWAFPNFTGTGRAPTPDSNVNDSDPANDDRSPRRGGGGGGGGNNDSSGTVTNTTIIQTIDSDEWTDATGITYLTDLTQNVGIGTATPGAKLEVVGSISGTSLKLAGLANCNTIDTDAAGNLICGTDEGGVAGSTEIGTASFSGAVMRLADARYVNVGGDTMTGTLAIDLSGTNVGIGLEVVETISGSIIFANRGLSTSGSLVWEESASGASLYVATSINGAGLVDCDLSSQALKWDAATGRFSCGTVSTGNWSGTGALQTAFDNRFVNRSGDTMTGALTIDIASTSVGIGLEVIETISGSVLFANRSLSTSGSLVWEGAASGASLYVASSINGAGLADCDLSSQALKWDATTGRFSCGTTTDTNTTYSAAQGLTLTGTGFSLSATISGSLLEFQTVSGALVYAKNTLASSGSLAVDGTAYLNASAPLKLTSAGFFGCTALETDADGDIVCGSDADTDTNTMYTAGQGLSLNGTSFSVNSTLTGSLIEFQTVSGAVVHAQSQLRSSGTLVADGDAFLNANLNVLGTTMLGDGDADSLSLLGDINSNISVDSNNSFNFGNISNRWAEGWFVNANLAGDLSTLGNSTLNGNVGIGASVTTTKAKLSVNGVMSGVTVYATRSFSGAGLSDCDTAGTSKLLWDATSGRFSCGTDSGATYTAGQGLTLNGSVLVLNSTITGSLLEFQTVSGALVYAKNTLASSGSLAVDGTAYLNASSPLKLTNAGFFGCTALETDADGDIVCGSDDAGGGSVTAGQGLSMNGSVLSLSSTITGSLLEFQTVSGAIVHAQLGLRSSGSLVVDGGATFNGQVSAQDILATGLTLTGYLNGTSFSGSSLDITTSIRGAGLADCDADNQTLQWDATTGRFSCGDDDTGGSSFTAGQGLALNGSVLVLNSTITGSLLEFQTVSGALVYAKNTLATSGSLVWEGTASGNTLAVSRIASHLIPSMTNAWDLGTSANRWRDLYLSGGTLKMGTAGNDMHIGYNAGSERLTFNANGTGAPEIYMTTGGLLAIGNVNPTAPLSVTGGILTPGGSLLSYGFEDNTISPLSSGSWSVATSPVRSGTYAAKVGGYGSSGSPHDMTYVIDVPAGGATVSYYRYVTLASGYGSFRFLVDGVTQETVNNAASWTQASFALAEGSRTLTWRVIRDFENVDEIDYAAIDDISISSSASGINRASATFAGLVGIGTTVPTVALDVRGSAIFNEAGSDFDFRIESENNAAMFVLDAGLDRIGVGTTLPDATFDVVGTISGSLVTQNGAGTNYFRGNLGIGTASVDTGVSLEVVGTASGRVLYAQQSLRSSGSLVWEGAGSGSSLYVASSLRGVGLSDCDAGSSKLLWDATTGRFSCGTDQSGGSSMVDHYVLASGDTMTGALVIDVDGGMNTTVGLNVINTISGAVLYVTDHIAGPNSTIDIAGHVQPTIDGFFTLGTNTNKWFQMYSNWGTFSSGLGVGTEMSSSDAKLEVAGTASGRVIFANDALRSSGSLVWEGAASGATLYIGGALRGVGLGDCDNATASKLLWDATTGRFSCGTDQSAGGSFTAGQGLTLNSTVLSLNASVSGSLLMFQTVSGALVHADRTLSSSGVLIVRDTIRGHSGAVLSGALLPIYDDRFSLGSSTQRWKDLYLGPGSLHIGASDNEGVLSYNTSNSRFEFNKGAHFVGLSETIFGGPVTFTEFTNGGSGCTSLETNASGNLVCGTDDTDALWSDGGSYLYPAGSESINIGGVTGYGYNILSSSATSNHSFSSSQDLFVGGMFEVDGAAYLDSSTINFASFTNGGAGCSALETDSTGNLVCGSDDTGSISVLNLGGASAQSYNFLSSGGSPSLGDVNSSNDLYIEGSLEVDGSINLGSFTNGGFGCTSLETDSSGNLVCGSDDTGSISVLNLGGASAQSYNFLSSGGGPSLGDVNSSNDLYIEGSLEVDGSINLGSFTNGGFGCTSLETDSSGNLVCGSDDNSGGTMSSFSIYDGFTTETINNGETITFTDSDSIDVVVSATDTVTFNYVNYNGYTNNSYANDMNQYTNTTSNVVFGGLDLDSDTLTGTDNMLRIITDVAADEDVAFRIQANGEVYSDGAYSAAGADYAEWFMASGPLPQRGEVVCIDVDAANTVKRCDRDGDGNVMGIVSTNPAFVGNVLSGAEGLPVPNTVLVGLIGQVPTKVVVENGEAIRAGDSLTAASIPGYARKALPGESTVGVALEALESGEGRINVLISRRNQSLTVSTVEQEVLDQIQAMEIGDEIELLVAEAMGDLNVDQSIIDEVSRQVDSLNVGNAIEEEVSRQIAMLRDQMLDVARSSATDPVASSGATAVSVGADLVASTLQLTASLSVDGDARIVGDLHLDGALVTNDLFVPGILAVDGSLTASTMTVTNDASVHGTLTLHGPLVMGSGASLQFGSGLTLADLIVERSLAVLGDVTVHGMATFLGDVAVEGELTVARQAGHLKVPLGATGATFAFDPPFTGLPIVTASPNKPVLYAVSVATSTGFTVSLAAPAEAGITFSWVALVIPAGAVTIEEMPLGIAFPVDERGVPVSSSLQWNACIRGLPLFDASGVPYSCSRYHDGNTWEHPDLAISFVWNDAVTPPYMLVPDGYVSTVTENAESVRAAILDVNGMHAASAEGDGETPETESVDPSAGTGDIAEEQVEPSVEASVVTPEEQPVEILPVETPADEGSAQQAEESAPAGGSTVVQEEPQPEAVVEPATEPAPAVDPASVVPDVAPQAPVIE